MPDDNQGELEACLEKLLRELPRLIAARACAAMVIGSTLKVGERRGGTRADELEIVDKPRINKGIP